MIGPLGFAFKNLQRRGFHSFLALLGIILNVASTIFLLLLANGLFSAFRTSEFSDLTFGIGFLVLGFLILTFAAVIIIGLISTSHLVSVMINQRVKDFAIMKAVGFVSRRLFSYIIVEEMVITFSGTIIGAIVALSLYISVGALLFAPFNTVVLSSSSILIIVAIVIASLVIAYVVAGYRVNRIIAMNTPTLLSFETSSLDLKKLGSSIRFKFLGSPFNLAAKTSFRDRQYGRTFVRLSICIFLSILILTGAIVAMDTSKNYVERAIPSHVYVLAKQSVWSEYALLGTSLFSSNNSQTTNYSNGTYLIPQSVIDQVNGTVGVQTVDARLMVTSTVIGYLMPQPEMTTPIGNLVTGAGTALAFGISPGHVVGQWYTSNGFLTNQDANSSVVIGDNLVGRVVQAPIDQSEIRVLGYTFNIKSMLVDPMNHGQVVYAPIRFVQTLLGLTGYYNIVLVSIRDESATLPVLQKLADQNGLVLESQGPILNKNINVLNNIWTSILTLPLMVTVLTSTILFSYLTSGFSKRFNDYVIVKILGAGKYYLLKLLFWESWGLLAISILISMSLAIVFTIFLLVPEAVINITGLSIYIIAAFIILSLPAIISSIVYAWRLQGVTVKDLKI